jgi:hypothetical protein
MHAVVSQGCKTGTWVDKLQLSKQGSPSSAMQSSLCWQPQAPQPQLCKKRDNQKAGSRVLLVISV